MNALASQRIAAPACLVADGDKIVSRGWRSCALRRIKESMRFLRE